MCLDARSTPCRPDPLLAVGSGEGRLRRPGEPDSRDRVCTTMSGPLTPGVFPSGPTIEKHLCRRPFLTLGRREVRGSRWVQAAPGRASPAGFLHSEWASHQGPGDWSKVRTANSRWSKHTVTAVVGGGGRLTGTRPGRGRGSPRPADGVPRTSPGRPSEKAPLWRSSPPPSARPGGSRWTSHTPAFACHSDPAGSLGLGTRGTGSHCENGFNPRDPCWDREWVREVGASRADAQAMGVVLRAGGP